MKRFLKVAAFAAVVGGMLVVGGVREARADGFSFSISSGPSYPAYGVHSGMFGYGPGAYSSANFSYGYPQPVIVHRYPYSPYAGRSGYYGHGGGHYSRYGHPDHNHHRHHGHSSRSHGRHGW